MEKNSNIKQKILPDAEDDTKLFKIGEVADALGLTRRILINYEDLGLVTPTVRNEGKGFRYYSADNVVHIRLIRALQNLGLRFRKSAATLKITNIWTIKSIT